MAFATAAASPATSAIWLMAPAAVSEGAFERQEEQDKDGNGGNETQTERQSQQPHPRWNRARVRHPTQPVRWLRRPYPGRLRVSAEARGNQLESQHYSEEHLMPTCWSVITSGMEGTASRAPTGTRLRRPRFSRSMRSRNTLSRCTCDAKPRPEWQSALDQQGQNGQHACRVSHRVVT